MLQAFLIMSLLAVAAAFIAYKKDPFIIPESARSSAILAVKVIPLIVVALFLAALVERIMPRNLIIKYVGSGSGWKGLFIGSLLGIITPGGPFVQFPIVMSLFKAGADIGPLVAYLSAWALLGMSRVLMIEVPLLGLPIVTVRFLSSLLFPPIMGFVAKFLWRLFRFS
ncbi:MAG: permease [Deltaproteobacteria bacterium]|nr:permease [Deltaproteobacteria bacterium]MBW2068435.1 permease [Deltaproteobacteria bacterium]